MDDQTERNEMFVGFPKEMKVHVYRVGLTPDSSREFATDGHRVVVESRAGAGIGCSDDDYFAATDSGYKYVDTIEALSA